MTPQPPLDHIGIAVNSLDDASAGFQLLGLRPEGADERVDAVQTLVRCFQVGDALIELVAPDGDASPLKAFLAERGPGLHHVALRVDDLEAELERLCAAGAEILIEPFTGRIGSRVAFLAPDEGAGTIVELVEHAAPH